jgi:hypothetical protein
MVGGGGGGAPAGTFCTIHCDNAGAPDPKCSDAVFTGNCGGQGDCEVR